MIMSSSSLCVVIKNGFYDVVVSSPRTADKNSANRSSSCPPQLSSVRTGGLRRSNSTVSTQISDDTCVSSPDHSLTTTTLMIRNIPTRFTSTSFLDILYDSGFSGTFDFFYLPMDFRTGKNMGYAFLNFTMPYFANLFAHMFHGTRLGLTTSSKVLHISRSRRQGLIENIELFKNSDLLSSESYPCFKPFVSVPLLIADPACGLSSYCQVLSPLTTEIFAYLTQQETF